MAKKISERGRNEETSRNFRKEAKGSERGNKAKCRREPPLFNPCLHQTRRKDDRRAGLESGERGGGVLRTTRVGRKRSLVGAAAEAAVGTAGAVAVAAAVTAASPGAGIATAAVRVVVTAAVRRLGMQATTAAAAVTNSAV